MVIGMTIGEVRSLFLRGVCGFRPLWIDKVNRSGCCDCGSLGTHKDTGGYWECDDCQAKNALVVHEQDTAEQFMEHEEWEQAQAARRESRRQDSAMRRQWSSKPLTLSDNSASLRLRERTA